jgi:hypothetical protein
VFYILLLPVYNMRPAELLKVEVGALCPHVFAFEGCPCLKR